MKRQNEITAERYKDTKQKTQKAGKTKRGILGDGVTERRTDEDTKIFLQRSEQAKKSKEIHKPQVQEYVIL